MEVAVWVQEIYGSCGGWERQACGSGYVTTPASLWWSGAWLSPMHARYRFCTLYRCRGLSVAVVARQGKVPGPRWNASKGSAIWLGSLWKDAGCHKTTRPSAVSLLGRSGYLLTS